MEIMIHINDKVGHKSTTQSIIQKYIMNVLYCMYVYVCMSVTMYETWRSKPTSWDPDWSEPNTVPEPLISMSLLDSSYPNLVCMYVCTYITLILIFQMNEFRNVINVSRVSLCMRVCISKYLPDPRAVKVSRYVSLCSAAAVMDIFLSLVITYA